MNLQPTSTQAEIAETARRLLADLFPLTRPLDTGPTSVADVTSRWRRLGEAGFFRLSVHEDAGGAGVGLAEQALVCRELGRQAAPLGIIPSMLAADLAHTPARLAARLQAGEAAAGAAFAAPGPPRDSEEAQLEVAAYASGQPLGYLLVRPGASGFVADESLDLRWGPCLARDLRAGEGLVDARLLALSLDDDVFWRGAVMVASALVGLAETALDLAVTHARTRIQFGAPIGVNQAVRHPCADVATQVEVAWAQVLHAALAVQAGAPDAPYLTACARVLASDVARASSRTCIQIHGGLGVTDEFPAHRLLKQSAVADRWFGPSEFHLGLLASQPPTRRDRPR